MTDKPTDTDVLLGRGVATNRHRGNENFRAIVSQHVDVYVTGTKKEKMMISRSIVKKVQTELEPPGRFLKRCAETGLWHEVEDKRALEKIAQALRDGAAPLRIKLSEDNNSAYLERLFGNDPDFMEKLLGAKASGNGRSSSAPPNKKVIPKPKQQSETKTAMPMDNLPASSGDASINLPRPKEHRSNPDIASGLDSHDLYQLFNPSLFQSQGQSGNTNPINQPVHQQIEHVPPQPKFQSPFAFLQDNQNPTMPQNQLLSSATMSVFGSANEQQVHKVHSTLSTAFGSSNDQQSSLTDIFNAALFDLPGLQLPSISVSAPPSLFSTQHNDTAIQHHCTSSYLTGTTTSINDSVNTMGPLSHVPPPQEVECHQVEPSFLEDAYPSRRRSKSASPTLLTTDAMNTTDKEEFVREMGPDEHFFGLCNSDPIGDADFDGDANFDPT